MKLKSITSLDIIAKYLKNKFGNKLIGVKFTDYDTDDFDVAVTNDQFELAEWLLRNQASLWRNGKTIIEMTNWCEFVKNVVDHFGGDVKTELLRTPEYRNAYEAA